MATKTRSKAPKRVSELRDEIDEAVERASSDEGVRGVLDTLDALRQQGLGRSHFNLESPYGRGMAHCEVDESPD